MNVLSLFDGIGCARLALSKLRVKPSNYWSSEIDPYALDISNRRFSDVQQVGDVTQLDRKTFGRDKIHLLVGGSPCQGFSLIGEQLNLEDERSRLVLEYIRLVKQLKPTWFLLENVKMNEQSRNFISSKLGVEPVKLNSALVSAQNRERLYWTNLPITEPKDKKLSASDMLNGSGFLPATVRKASGDLPRRVVSPKGDKFGCLTASYYKGINGDGRPAQTSIFGPYLDSDICMLTPEQCEALQTIPEGHTAGVSKTQRYKAIGNAFTVDMVAHLLKGVK